VTSYSVGEFRKKAGAGRPLFDNGLKGGLRVRESSRLGVIPRDFPIRIRAQRSWWLFHSDLRRPPRDTDRSISFNVAKEYAAASRS